MATSGSWNWAQTSDDICRAALRICGALDPGETAPATDINTTRESLNYLLKSWQNSILGFQLWTQKRGTLFLALSQSEYRLGSSGDHATASYVETTMAATANTGDRTVILTNNGTGTAINDYIGITLGNGSIQWTSLSATVSSSGTAQIASSLSATSTTSRPVYVYTNKIQRPVELISCWVRDSTNNDYSLTSMTRERWVRIYDKTRDSRPRRYHYAPFDPSQETDNLTNGRIYLDWEPDDTTDTVEFLYRRQLQDVDTNTDNPDVPSEVLKALKWNLAAEIAPEYGVPPAIQDRLNERAASTLIEVRGLYSDMPRQSIPWGM